MEDIEPNSRLDSKLQIISICPIRNHPSFEVIGENCRPLPDCIFNFELQSSPSLFIKLILFFSFIFIVLNIKGPWFDREKIWESDKVNIIAEIGVNFRNLNFDPRLLLLLLVIRLG